MDIVNGTESLSYWLHEYLEETFGNEDGKVIYTITLINYATVCPTHGLEHRPIFRVNLWFENENEPIRFDIMVEINSSIEELKEVFNDSIDAYRRVALDIELNRLEF